MGGYKSDLNVLSRGEGHSKAGMIDDMNVFKEDFC